jgi:Lhr-like helicase
MDTKEGSPSPGILAKPVAIDPGKINVSLNEAFVDGLLNIIYARCAGAGEFGEVIYRGKPSMILTSGFLLPSIDPLSNDDVSNDIQIGAQGVDFQIAVGVHGDIVVTPDFSIYVRVLPTKYEVESGIFRVGFRLRKELEKAFREKKKERLDQEWNLNQAAYGTDGRRSEAWKAKRIEIESKVREELGISEYWTKAGKVSLIELIPDDSAEDAVEPEEVNGLPKPDEEIEVGMPVVGWMPDRLAEPVKVPQKWLRLKFEAPALRFDPSWDDNQLRKAIDLANEALMQTIERAYGSWLQDDDLDTGGKLWAYREGLSVLPSDLRNWDKFLERARREEGKVPQPRIKVEWSVDLAADPLNPGERSVRIALENNTERRRRPPREVDEGIFQVSLRCRVPKEMHRPLHLERVKPSYRYNRYLSYAAMGFNCGVTTCEEHGALVLETTWMPRYQQPRIRPVPRPGVETRIAELAKSDGLERLATVVVEFERWVAEVGERVDPSAGLSPDQTEKIKEERSRLRFDLDQWQREIGRIRRGLDILRKSKIYWSKPGGQEDPRAIPFEAWLAMNETMAYVAEQKGYTEWRLFQIAFILSTIPAITTRLEAFRDLYRPEDDEAVTLLYFATGGGKSEAFFGLVVLALFFDRLRGKLRGVTSLIRYPLRLLTIQQAQRAAIILAQAERVRRSRLIAGQPFEIGFWVGSTNTPNFLYQARDVPFADRWKPEDEGKLRRKQSDYVSALDRWNKLPECPFCMSQTVLRRFKHKGGMLGHACCKLDRCEWNVWHSGGPWEPLPFLIVDQDIYAYAPSILLGTVDKLALIGQSPQTIRRVLGMFGAAPWIHEETGRLHIPTKDEIKQDPSSKGYLTVAPHYYTAAREIFVDPFPSLIIQDETHLLEESLGTFAALFETGLEAVLGEMSDLLGARVVRAQDGTWRRPKVIAASATVSNAERQIENLYQRSLIQFPHPGPDLYSSFYATPVRSDELTPFLPKYCDDPEETSEWARFYVSLMTNGKPHTTTSVAILVAFHLTLTDLIERILAPDDAVREQARALLSRFVSQGLRNSLYTSKVKGATWNELATLIHLHKIALTYVTNKKGGDQIVAAQSETFRREHELAGLAKYKGIRTELITGAVDAAQIQQVIKIAKGNLVPGANIKDLLDEMRSIVATSAVSHGVDVDELNSMFFAGMPADVAEYIQASSRIGRKFTGFSLLIPTPQRRRDRYIVEVHDIYHRFLERMILPASIDRWAETALLRSIPSFFQAFIAGTFAVQAFAQAPDSGKPRAASYARVSEIKQELLNARTSLTDRIVGFIGKAAGLGRSLYIPYGADYYEGKIKGEVKTITDDLQGSTYETSILRSYFDDQGPLKRPMTSLRDVDKPGYIWPDGRELGGRRSLDLKDLARVMKFLRRGSGVEVDTEELEGLEE